MWGLYLTAPEAEAGENSSPVEVSARRPEVEATAAADAKAPTGPSPFFDDGQAGLFGNGGDGGPRTDETLEQIEAEALECVACKLHEGRNKVVFGTGNPTARLMFIGEGPGRDEDRQGEPFVGRAGRLLTKIIEAMGYERGDVYIANVVKCRPPQNRNPQADEMSACEHFLFRQIAVIRPQIIVLLGRVAVQAILQSSAPMSRLRGRFQRWRGIPVMCTYHPAYLLRNPNAKKDVWEDMQIVRDALAEGRE
jgi:DNA polymerase